MKKQFHDTCKIQERQYKVLRKQMLANAPREKHREIIQKFKEDRMRKFADLGSQYDQSINDLLQKQKVSFLHILDIVCLSYQKKLAFFIY